jgi:hypothetical protein
VIETAVTWRGLPRHHAWRGTAGYHAAHYGVGLPCHLSRRGHSVAQYFLVLWSLDFGAVDDVLRRRWWDVQAVLGPHTPRRSPLLPLTRTARCLPLQLRACMLVPCQRVVASNHLALTHLWIFILRLAPSCMYNSFSNQIIFYWTIFYYSNLDVSSILKKCKFWYFEFLLICQIQIYQIISMKGKLEEDQRKKRQTELTDQAN